MSQGGLGPALRTLVRRSPVPVELHLDAESRYPPPVEVAAYYVVSEALTNMTKHADASVKTQACLAVIVGAVGVARSALEPYGDVGRFDSDGKDARHAAVAAVTEPQIKGVMTCQSGNPLTPEWPARSMWAAI